MCPESCVAYTGPYDELEICPHCSTPQYIAGDNKKAQKQFSTIPIGPVIQALYSSHDIAEHMHYLEQRLAQNMEHVLYMSMVGLTSMMILLAARSYWTLGTLEASANLILLSSS